jgi:hypothetical protein
MTSSKQKLRRADENGHHCKTPPQLLLELHGFKLRFSELRCYNNTVYLIYAAFFSVLSPFGKEMID